MSVSDKVRSVALPTPEERAARIGQCLVHLVPSHAFVVSEIRAAEEAARSKAFEEVIQLLRSKGLLRASATARQIIGMIQEAKEAPRG